MGPWSARSTACWARALSSVRSTACSTVLDASVVSSTARPACPASRTGQGTPPRRRRPPLRRSSQRHPVGAMERPCRRAARAHHPRSDADTLGTAARRVHAERDSPSEEISMYVAADYPLMDVIWRMLVFFAWVIWFWLLITVFSDLFRRHDVSGWGKAGWTALVIVLPYLGVFLSLIGQGKHMAERKMADTQASRAAFDDYVRDVAANGGSTD